MQSYFPGRGRRCKHLPPHSSSQPWSSCAKLTLGCLHTCHTFIWQSSRNGGPGSPTPTPAEFHLLALKTPTLVDIVFAVLLSPSQDPRETGMLSRLGRYSGSQRESWRPLGSVTEKGSNPALKHIGCVSLGKFPNHSWPVFPSMKLW